MEELSVSELGQLFSQVLLSIPGIHLSEMQPTRPHGSSLKLATDPVIFSNIRLQRNSGKLKFSQPSYKAKINKQKHIKKRK